ncbi:hypothetical protein J3R83DRAFT_13116 [Lanmaoa asiatica]|nr:hypothetical protein J3R83DRAFT_13116 [Lanmaoa asiatica]
MAGSQPSLVAPDPVNVRIITTLGHVDHGKTTLMDALLAANNIISPKMAGKLRYLDSREDEIERGITMESSAVSLKFQVKEGDDGIPPKTYIINMIDTPGHVDFSTEVSTASRLCDGALVLVDVVEGVCTQTIAVLRQAWHDKIRPILVINKFDRLITELKLAPIEAYHHLTRLIEQVNVVMGEFFASERMEDDLRWREERDRRLAAKKDRYADEGEAAANEEDTFKEKDDEDIYFAPERGNVVFASAIDGWGFRVGKFAQLYSAKLGFKEVNLRRVLWGDFYLDPKTKRVISYKHLRGRALKPLFVHFVLENVWAVYDAVILNPNAEKVAKIVSALNLKLLPRDLRSKDTRQLLSLIFNQWLSLSTCVIQSIIDVVPSPSAAQAIRLPRMLYPNVFDQEIQPKNKLERDLYCSNSGAGAYIVVYVSKMFAVPRKELPENKVRPLTAEELRMRGRAAREARKEAASNEFGSIPIPATSEDTTDAPETLPVANDEILLGFARLYSGTIKVGTKIYCILPKYDVTLSPDHPANVNNIAVAEVEGLYVMMGRQLQPVASVEAGNTFAIKGLEGKVWRNATLCSPGEAGIIQDSSPQQDQECLINLGGANRMVTPPISLGFPYLAQADPCVETFQQQTGEHVILTAGELHLERCLKDLRERFARVEIQASKPIVPFRETAIKAPDMAPPKTPGAARGTMKGGSSQNIVTFTLRSAPLPDSILLFIQQNLATLRLLLQERKSTDRGTSGGDSNTVIDGDHPGMQGNLVHVPSVKPEQFWVALKEKCLEAGGEWADIVDRIWAFGPHGTGDCLLIDARKDIIPISLKRRLMRDQVSDASHTENGSHKDFDFTSHIETGFQLATFQGPLCAEPVEGVTYFIEDVRVDVESLEKETIVQNRLTQVTGSVISAVRDACRNALLDWSPRLKLAMYSCDIQASTDVLGKVYGVVAKRRGRIVGEEMKEGTTYFTVSALLPVVESFGFADDIRKRTSGAASPQLIFSGYEMLDQDPFWVPTTEEELEDIGEKADRSNLAKEYMDAVRERKGMFVDRKIVQFAEKQRTLKRLSMATFGVACGGLTYQNGVSPEVPEEQYITTFFCRALYDYQTNDASSLSFRKNDIIEVLTQLESGWWDGLLGDERGWFPSNYVTIISDEEAELALSHYEQQALQHRQFQQARETSQDPQERNGHLQREIVQDHFPSETEWGAGELVDSSNGFLEFGNAISEGEGMSNDFWMPQIYYVNTQTGQHSRDLPLDIDDTSDDDLAGLTASQPSARAGTGAGLGFGALAETALAGFGIPKRSGTPEPWTRRLADDGMSYFYMNKLTGQVSWTLPETEVSAKKGRARALTDSSTASEFSSSHDESDQITRSRSDSAASQSCGVRERRHSISEPISDSDDSAVYSSDPDISPSTSRSSQNGQQDDPAPTVQRSPGLELTAAERIAQSLQQSLAPYPPELVSDLSHIARDAIVSVVQKNQSLHGVARRPEHAQVLDNLIRSVVVAVRNLLYVSAPPSGHIPSQLIPRDARGRRETTAAQTLLKPAQRKVTATLSKLVLSARAMEYDSGPAAQETVSRIESDAEELDRAIVAFVVEVQRYHNEQEQATVGAKRVQGCFSVIHVGLGLVGAGCGGTWKGFGWVPMDDTEEFPQIVLSSDAFSEFKTHMVSVQAKFGSLHTALRHQVDESQQRVWIASKDVLTGLLTLLLFVSNLHVARHVDIDGFYSESAVEEKSALYTQTVDKARLLSRTLESAMQSLYDDASILFLTTQHIRRSSGRVASQDRDDLYDYLDAIAASIKSNLQFLLRTLDALLSVGHDQADIAEGDYKGAIDWRVSRLSIMDSHYDVRPMSVLNPADPESEDIVDIELAFGAPGSKKGMVQPDRVPSFRSQSQMSDNTITLEDLSKPDSMRNAGSSDYSRSVHTLVPSERHTESMSDKMSFNDDECRTATNAQKIKKIFGDDAPEHIISTKPWHLRPDYTKNDMVIDVDGSVRAGTVPALVERLTSHETGDPTFIKTFLMTYKSFTTLEELFDLLVRRFYIHPPDNLNPTELEEWKKLKQHIIQMRFTLIVFFGPGLLQVFCRVLNTFKAMVADDDFLEKEDMYMLDRMKDFLLQDAVSKIAISKQLVILIDRARAGELKKTITPNLVSPPTSILPKAGKRVKLLDVDPLELARQLTILESQLYQRIRPMECLSRSREQKTDHNDNIARVIQTSNRIANWVADAVLAHEDSKKRAIVLKHFILTADRCRFLHNYSSMVAIVSGLNSPPIRRLKRSWEQVNSRHMTQLNTCEMTIDSGKNFTNYRSTLAKVAPPCVPFIGVLLTTLTFIQDGSKDTLPGNLVNFRKRQKASEVIQDIQRWQTLPHHFHPLSAVQMYIEESLGKFSDQVDVGDMFWNLSLEREPREREDEKMARLLQESGFL